MNKTGIMLISYFKVIMKNAHFAGTVPYKIEHRFFTRMGSIKSKGGNVSPAIAWIPHLRQRKGVPTSGCEVCSSDIVIDEGKRGT